VFVGLFWLYIAILKAFFSFLGYFRTFSSDNIMPGVGNSMDRSALKSLGNVMEISGNYTVLGEWSPSKQCVIIALFIKTSLGTAPLHHLFVSIFSDYGVEIKSVQSTHTSRRLCQVFMLPFSDLVPLDVCYFFVNAAL